MQRGFIPLFVVLTLGLSINAVAGEKQDSLYESLDLSELLNMEITTASNVAEKLSDAPATVIVVTRDDIEKRGYRDLSQIFDDLPGMEMTRAYADTYFKNYMRGFRNDIGVPFLLMVDGLIFNHLWFNEGEILGMIPITNVEQIEVVYGPASAVYGANAFMGVINVITRNDMDEDGVSVSARTSLMNYEGGLDRLNQTSELADMNILYKNGTFRLSVTGRFDFADIDRDSGENFEWTKKKYASDEKLWGALVNNRNSAGRVSSPWRHRALDVRAYLDKTELGFQYYMLDTGYGLVYPFDKIPPQGIWSEPNYSAHLRHTHSFSDQLTSKTMIRFREDGVGEDSYDQESWDDVPTSQAGDPEAVAERIITLTHWQAISKAYSLTQDFTYATKDYFTDGDKFTTNFGLKYVRKDLQKAYDRDFGDYVTPAESVADPNAFYGSANPEGGTLKGYNHAYVDDHSLYGLVKWGPNDDHILNAGVRVDYNSVYGAATTVRGGYTGHFGDLTAKLLFGQAYMEPIYRNLYGGWGGSGSDPDLSPEEAWTAEAIANYTTRSFSIQANAYKVQQTNIITSYSGKPENSGQRDVLGGDLHLQTFFTDLPGIDRLRAWFYYSGIFQIDEFVATEGKEDQFPEVHDIDSIPDIASMKFWLGLTAEFSPDISATFRARYYGDREGPQDPAVITKAFVTGDLNLEWKNALADGIKMALTINNVTDATYFHPGMRSANSGDTAGSWDGDTWNGSSGWYNAKYPQPGRSYMLTLGLDI